MNKVKIKALPGTTMVPGKVYEVCAFNAEKLIEFKRAVKSGDSEEVGKVYEYSEKKEK